MKYSESMTGRWRSCAAEAFSNGILQFQVFSERETFVHIEWSGIYDESA